MNIQNSDTVILLDKNNRFLSLTSKRKDGHFINSIHIFNIIINLKSLNMIVIAHQFIRITSVYVVMYMANIF